MSHSRRTFLQSALAAGTLVPMAAAAMPRPAAQDDLDGVEEAKDKLRILFLGGTAFLGPHTVEYLLARGHEVTLFNRGRTNTDLFPGLEKLGGDRDPDKGEGLGAIESALEQGRAWDAVIDTSGYFPRHVAASATLLAGVAKQYVFVSSISVYSDMTIVGMDETAPVGTMDDPALEEFGPGWQNYGPLKAYCEQAAEQAMPGRASNIRSGLIVGPLDRSDRFTYWPVRVSQGGEVLSPGTPDDPVQFIDVRDLGRFLVRCAEQRTSGVFNTTGPVYPTSIGELLHGCKAVTGGSARFTWVDADFLVEHEVSPWGNTPVWTPTTGEAAGMGTVDCRRAIAAGMATRPLAETVRATLDWFHTLPQERQAALGPDAVARTPENAQDDSVIKRRVGISAAREAEVLAAWHARTPAVPG